MIELAESTGSYAPPQQSTVPFTGRVGLLYVVLALTSFGYSLMCTGIYFYTHHRFGWTLPQNLSLAAVQGAVYVGGSLLSHRVAARFGPSRALSCIYGSVGLLALICAIGLPVPLLTGVLILYTFVTAHHAPILESLISTGVDAQKLSRRIGIYNLIWSGVGALTIAVDGSIIERWPLGIFVIPVVVHFAAAVLVAFWNQDAHEARTALHQPQECPPELLTVRTIALWLSRLSLPATYVVVYSLLAMMPSFPIMQHLSPTRQTLLASVWMISRWLTFLVLGATVWWHTRPRLLLLAGVVMLVSFLGVSFGTQYLWMIGCQLALGAALGLIYAGSLYFGMVLSQGSTEHGGYHEALIGMGACIGPGSGALVEFIAPNTPRLCVFTVAGLVSLTILAGAIAAVRASKRTETN